MRTRPALAALAAGALPLLVSSMLHSVPEDPAAFPKYRVLFLNGLPVLNDTAERWLANGLRGGEHEFLEQPWDAKTSTGAREIGQGDERADDASRSSKHELEHMRLGPDLSFLCFIPPPLDPPQPHPEEESAQTQVDPTQSWSLLQPLEGSCIYHRQAWFTYSYCHNKHVRQFREAAHPATYPAGGYVPQEDAEWESYTLGQAPPPPPPGSELSVVKEYARASHVELQRGAGAHYLVERWHDGTLCDKTGRPREIEVQFHCSMGGPDTILFVKETRTCAYVLVVHTPRLCAVPGFRAPQDAHEQAEVRCRQVVDELGSTNPLLPPSEVPAGLVVQVPSIPAPPVTAPPAKGQAASNIRQLVDRLLGPDMDVSDVVIEQLPDGSYVIELAEDVDYADDYGAGGDGYGYSQGDDAGGNAGDNVREEALLEMLRAAGIDVAGYVTTPRPPKSEADKDAAEQRKEKKSPTPPPK